MANVSILTVLVSIDVLVPVVVSLDSVVVEVCAMFTQPVESYLSYDPVLVLYLIIPTAPPSLCAVVPDGHFSACVAPDASNKVSVSCKLLCVMYRLSDVCPFAL